MPTRSYYFPTDFSHLEEILRSEDREISEEVLADFRQKRLPPITSEGALALFLGISPQILWSIRLKTSKHYRKFSIPKKQGAPREITAPRTYLKVIQWWVLDNVLGKCKLPESIFGFVPGRSILDNARYHAGASVPSQTLATDFP